MDKGTQEIIKETVLEILKDANLDEMTVTMVRKIASEKLDIELSEPAGRKFVRDVVDSFCRELEAKADRQEENEEEKKKAAEVVDLVDGEINCRKRCEREYDDYGGQIICRLSKYRRVTVHEYKRKTLVSLREFFNKDGKQIPKTKGISLTCEQWTTLKKNIPNIDKAIKEMKSM